MKINVCTQLKRKSVCTIGNISSRKKVHFIQWHEGASMTSLDKHAINHGNMKIAQEIKNKFESRDRQLYFLWLVKACMCFNTQGEDQGQSRCSKEGSKSDPWDCNQGKIIQVEKLSVTFKLQGKQSLILTTKRWFNYNECHSRSNPSDTKGESIESTSVYSSITLPVQPEEAKKGPMRLQSGMIRRQYLTPSKENNHWYWRQKMIQSSPLSSATQSFSHQTNHPLSLIREILITLL